MICLLATLVPATSPSLDAYSRNRHLVPVLDPDRMMVSGGFELYFFFRAVAFVAEGATTCGGLSRSFTGLP